MQRPTLILVAVPLQLSLHVLKYRHPKGSIFAFVRRASPHLLLLMSPHALHHQQQRNIQLSTNARAASLPAATTLKLPRSISTPAREKLTAGAWNVHQHRVCGTAELICKMKGQSLQRTAVPVQARLESHARRQALRVHQILVFAALTITSHTQDQSLAAHLCTSSATVSGSAPFPMNLRSLGQYAGLCASPTALDTVACFLATVLYQPLAEPSAFLICCAALLCCSAVLCFAVALLYFALPAHTPNDPHESQFITNHYPAASPSRHDAARPYPNSTRLLDAKSRPGLDAKSRNCFAYHQASYCLCIPSPNRIWASLCREQRMFFWLGEPHGSGAGFRLQQR